MAHKSQNGMWILNRGEAQWLAWREWWLGPFNHKFWPHESKRCAMVSEWPPETEEAAALVAEYWIGVRNKIADDEKKTKLSGGGWTRPIPVFPKPWIRWSAEERERKVRWFAEEDNPPDVRRSPDTVARMIREAVETLRAPRPQPRNKIEPENLNARPAATEKSTPYNLAKLAEEKASDRLPVQMAAE